MMAARLLFTDIFYKLGAEMKSAVIFLERVTEEHALLAMSAIKEVNQGVDIDVYGFAHKGMPTRFHSLSENAVEEKEIKNMLENKKYYRVILVGIDREYKLEISTLVKVLSTGVDAINIFIDGEIVRYAPFKEKVSNTILVFPGAMLPLNMGSHQRAFLLLAALNYSGIATDVLITGPDENIKASSKRLLQSIAPNVYTYRNKKRKLPTYLSLRRDIEREYNKFFKKTSKVPELFADRYANKATESLKKTLATLQKKKRYKNIIISYAWLTKCLDYIDNSHLANTKLFCDTHDVQFVRNQSNRKKDKRFFPCYSIDKWLEIYALRKYHRVLAISGSDYNQLINVKPLRKKVLKVSSAFNYAFSKPRKISQKTVLNFGFIGGKMEANVEALKNILNDWWPTIQRLSPASKLFVAGSVSLAEEIESFIAFEPSVEALGFVDDLTSFYNKIDISLNPVVVQGGLNFKSVEAVLAGKLLWTNPHGAQCINNNEMIDIIEDKRNIEELMTNIELMGSDLEDLIKRRQNIALRLFGEEAVYEDLKLELSK